MHRVNTVIFDVGRVLVGIDTDGEKFARLAWAAGIPPGQAFKTFSYYDEVRDFSTGGIGPEALYLAARSRLDLQMDFVDFVEAWCDVFAPMPGMEELFQRIGRHYNLGLLSDTDPLHWERLLELFPWLSLVQNPTLSFEVGYLKPHPRMYERAAENCGRRPHECLFIDDIRSNVDGARLFGMQALQFEGVDKLQRDLAGLGFQVT